VAADHGDSGGGAGAENGDGEWGGVGHRWNFSGEGRGVNLGWGMVRTAGGG
jgi:hypothetical protein